MEKNEIKKALYKEKPVATKIGEDETTYGYSAHIQSPIHLEAKRIVSFRVPKSEMGETLFEETVPAQLLIRWLV